MFLFNAEIDPYVLSAIDHSRPYARSTADRPCVPALIRPRKYRTSNGRRCVSEPEWTRARPSLDQKSVIDYIITDAQLLGESGDVCIDSTDIGMSDHFLVWLELGRTAKNSWKQKCTIRR